MVVTLDQIKALRDKTGVSITACKVALEESSGDEEKAIEILRKKGEAKAAERADRVTGEGVISIQLTGDNKRAAVVMVSCETDFVAKGSDFISTVNDFASRVLTDGKDVDLSHDISDLGLKSGEKVVLSHVETMEIEDGVIGAYVHSNFKVASIVQLHNGNPELGKDVAMHIVASSPNTVSPDEVAQSILDKEFVIWHEELSKSGKPEAIWDKILQGKEKKFREENALLTQPFVKNPEITVGDLLRTVDATVGKFSRISI